MAELLDQTSDALLKEAVQRLPWKQAHAKTHSPLPSIRKSSFHGSTSPTESSLNVRRPHTNSRHKDAAEVSVDKIWGLSRPTTLHATFYLVHISYTGVSTCFMHFSFRLHALPRMLRTSNDTAGFDWFFLKTTDLTPQLKRDWQLLGMRGLLDPKHRKKTLRSALPKYCRVAEVSSALTTLFDDRYLRKKAKHFLHGHIGVEKDSEKIRKKYAEVQRRRLLTYKSTH
ncbi:hypothetical protein L249_5428 [Ophiocordyceps polyrhachis-furcata BCC 54312]|uniref:Fcf2 pre-rRNA processing C-terminal domain-containing protein n=1 Tax=Ophiocordyceps polyrhachis-furcata BCC 54312 TaxID=1330021 RepID=A0A367L8Q4_9HYPO|nr:hypothetical protein L249_5428 [Ophiocordyceps polyrhachis-furcata BCC 54312]